MGLDSNKFTPQLTQDGSFTFFSQEFSETFHSSSGAKQEAQEKFIIPCQLAKKAKNNAALRLLDICYGLGYNSAAALATIWAANPQCSVELIALELDASVPSYAIDYHLLECWPSPIAQLLTQLAYTYHVQTSQLTAQLLLGDARKTIQHLYHSNFQADAIFLDPFSPPKCPQLWTVEFLAIVARCLKPNGRLATYSCAASVRTALNLARLKVGSTVGVGRRSPGTVASFEPDALLPLSEQEQQHLSTRAAIPYRDPHLQDTATVIWHRRQIEQQSSTLEPTSYWKKRWSKNVGTEVAILMD